jgi:nucleoside-triphosphatase THEP1
MDEHILTTLKILIIGESGVGKSRLVQFHFICVVIGGYIWTGFWLFKHVIVMNTALFPSCL